MVRNFALLACVVISFQTVAQFGVCDCTASVGSGTVNFSSLTWTGTGCPSGGSSYTGNLCVNLVNGSNLVIDTDFTVTGDFKITNSGNSTLTLPAGIDFWVTGNLGDATNNQVDFVIDGNLRVDGTVYGKNANAFSGSGSVDAGGLDFNTAPTCNPCNITWNVDACNPPSEFCTTVLPIELSYFRVSIPKGEKQTLIEWATEKEENFDHFEIQRAGSDLKFVSIRSVPGAGYSTNSLQEYEIYDQNPLVGTGYYRLKAVDIDGTVEYFYVRSVTFNGGRNFYVSPNPANGSSITYTINFDPSPYDRVILIDAVGKELFSGVVSGTENELIPNKALPQGAYLLRYVSAHYQQVARVFIK